MISSWIPVFKAGKHTDSAGNKKTWTEADLDTIVAKYQPADHEAPVVIGHPADNSPAWGWVESLKREGQLLFAKLKDVAPAFADMVRKGLFKKRSISLYPDMSLRHVGFLGAMPPAVKGLPDVAFKACEAGVTVEFATDCKNCKACVKNFGSAGGSPAEKGKETRGMKLMDWLKGKAATEGVTIEDAPVSYMSPPPTPASGGQLTEPVVNIKALVDAGVAQAVSAKELEFAERQNALAAKEAELKRREDVIKEAAGKRLRDEIASFCEGLCKAGKLTPAMRKAGMGLDTFMEKISAIQEVVEFSEGDKKVKQTPLEYMKSLLASAKKQIEFGEVATADKDVSGVDKREQAIRNYQEANKGMTYRDAVLAVSTLYPELFKQ